MDVFDVLGIAPFRYERQYEETGDITFAALAIGAWEENGRPPDDRPRWALDACRAFYDADHRAAEKYGQRRRGPATQPRDVEALDRMADMIVAGEAENFKAAAILVTGEPLRDTNTRRLARLWEWEKAASAWPGPNHARIVAAVVRAVHREGLAKFIERFATGQTGLTIPPR